MKTASESPKTKDPKIQKPKGLECARGAPGPAAMQIPKVWIFGFLDLWVFGFLGFWNLWVFGFLGFWDLCVFGFLGFLIFGICESGTVWDSRIYLHCGLASQEQGSRLGL